MSRDYLQELEFSIMARKKELTMNEKNYIIKEISKGKSSLQISKDLKSDHRTIKKICQMGIQPRKKKISG